METAIQKALTLHKEGKLVEAEKLYRFILKTEPNHLDANNNLGILMYGCHRFNEARINFKKFIELEPNYAEVYVHLGNTLNQLGMSDEAVLNYKKAIKLKPEYSSVYNNLSIALQKLNKNEEAEENCRKAIQLKPDYAEAYNNLSSVLKKLNRLEEAEENCRKAIQLKPDYALAYNNLGSILHWLNRHEEAEENCRKAIELKPDFADANINLEIILRENKILQFLKTKKLKDKTKINNLAFSGSLTSDPFICNRAVEADLLTNLYKINMTDINKIEKGALFGLGKRTTDYRLFESDVTILQILEKDLINIMKQAVDSDIFIVDSFFNIYGPGSGAISHTHLGLFDINNGLINQKFSLVYYLSVGDQNCNEPGKLKLHDPDEEILPSDGMVVIIPSSRKHSVIYSGQTDRAVIAVNFYSHL